VETPSIIKIAKQKSPFPINATESPHLYVVSMLSLA